jgi:hypothetical protein
MSRCSRPSEFRTPCIERRASKNRPCVDKRCGDRHVGALVETIESVNYLYRKRLRGYRFQMKLVGKCIAYWP